MYITTRKCNFQISDSLKYSNKMRSVALTVWFFLNVVLLGMCGYIYLLWLQYWRHITLKNQQAQESAYTQQPYVEYYDEGDFTTVHQSAPIANPFMHISETNLDKAEKIRQVTFFLDII